MNFRFAVIAALLTLALPIRGAFAESPTSFQAVVRSEISLPSFMGNGDVWGDGNTIVVALRDGGLAMVDVTDPDNPAELGTWNPGDVFVQDVKMGRDIVIATNESWEGPAVHILDVSDPANITTISTINSPAMTVSVHNVWVDTRGYLYLASNAPDPNVLIYDLRDPANPTYLSRYQHPEAEWGSYNAVHDMVVLDNVLYAAYLSAGFVLVDVSDPANPVEMARHNYDDSFAHNIWPTEDRNYVLTTDEVQGGHVQIWDVQDLGNIFKVSEYQTQDFTIVHNANIKGDLAYISYYEDGVRILDVADPTNPVEVAFHDTYLDPAIGDFRGNWGVWPYQNGTGEPGEPELIYCSNLEGQTVIVELQGARRTQVTGRVEREDGSSVGGADITVVESGRSVEADADGNYSLWTGSGDVTLQFSSFGQITKETSVTLAPNGLLALDMTLADATSPDVIVVDDDGGASIESFVVDWLDDLGHEVQVWDATRKGSLAPSRVARFEGTAPIVWLTGADEDGTIEPGDKDSLSTLIDIGHGVVLSGQYVGDELGSDDTWLSERFGAQHIDDTVEMPYLEGEAGDPITDGMLIQLITIGGGQVQNSPGEVVATSEHATPILHYAGLEDTYAAIRNNNGAARTVFIEFGIEGINDTEGFTGPEDFLESVLAWVGMPVGIGGEDGPPGLPGPARLELAQNAPNPFNPRTVIRFTVPVEAADEKVTLAIFDGAGRRVRTLVNRSLVPGHHAVTWDGTTDAGGPAASGRYVYRLITANDSESRSMLLIK